MKLVLGLLFGLLWAATPVIKAANTVPIVSYFSPYDTRSGDSNWGITQDAQGRIYAANRNGLLEYDGHYWELHTIPSPTKLVRSLYADSTSQRIYMGAFEEFGYFERMTDGELRYQSLSKQLKDYTLQNDEIWNILPYDGNILFQSFASFFLYDGTSVTPVKNDDELYLFFFLLNNRLYTNDDRKGLTRLDPSTNRFVKVPYPPLGSRIINAIQTEDATTIAITESSGIFTIDTQGTATRLDKFGTAYPQANRAIRSSRGELILGTINSGVYCLTMQGKVVWHIHEESGLVNNTVLNLFEGRQGEIWVGLNKGLAVIHNNSPFRALTFQGQNIGAIFSAQRLNDRYYIGTNMGLFVAPASDVTDVQPVPSASNQVWEIASFDNQTFVGTNRATYSIDGSSLNILSETSGGMTFQRATINGQDVVVGGTYSDICIYRKSANGRFVLSHILQGFCQPIRHIEVDYQGNLWCAHLRKGLYRLTLDNSLTKIVSTQYFSSVSRSANSEELVYVNKIGNRVVFSNDSLFYIYNEHDNKIIPYTTLNEQMKLFKGAARILPLPDNRYWVVKPSSAALIRWEANVVTFERIINLSPLKSLFVDNEQNIIPLSEGKHLFCLDNKFAVYDEHFTHDQEHNSTQLFISSVEYADRHGNRFRQLPQPDHRILLKASHNALIIRCTFPDHSHNLRASIRYRLYRSGTLYMEGLLESRQLTLHSLSSGDYLFEFEAIDDEGRIISSCPLAIRKQRHPLATPLAIVLYSLSVLTALLLAFQYKRRKLLTQYKQLEREHSRLRTEILMREENQKLSSELSNKGKELSSYALLQMKHNALLDELRKEVQAQKVALGTHFPKKNFQRLLTLMESDSSSKNDWEVFEQNFDLIHEHFFRTLKHKFPELTPNDLRLCGYLRLNIPSKEIAQLLNISPKGVEVARHRLRKKLNLDDTQNLVDFMIGMRSEQPPS